MGKWKGKGCSRQDRQARQEQKEKDGQFRCSISKTVDSAGNAVLAGTTLLGVLGVLGGLGEIKIMRFKKGHATTELLPISCEHHKLVRILRKIFTHKYF